MCRFSALLIVDPAAPKSIQQQLQAWIETRESDLQALLRWAEQKWTTTNQPTAAPYLMIQIQKSGQKSSIGLNYVWMNAWLITDDRIYNSQTGEGSEQLSVPDRPILFDEDNPQRN